MSSRWGPCGLNLLAGQRKITYRKKMQITYSICWIDSVDTALTKVTLLRIRLSQCKPPTSRRITLKYSTRLQCRPISATERRSLRLQKRPGTASASRCFRHASTHLTIYSRHQREKLDMD